MKRSSIVTLVVACLMGPAIVQGVTVGQIDGFQDGTLQGWDGGATETNEATGGPAGAGDRFMQVASAGSSGPGSRLAAFNLAQQWAGDYVSAGVTAVEADLKNFTAEALEIRLVLFVGSNNRVTSTVSFPLPADGQWHHAVFGVTPADLTVVAGAMSATDILTNADRLLIRHQPGAPTATAPAIIAEAGFDNIHALPEPTSLLLLGFGSLILVRRRG